MRASPPEVALFDDVDGLIAEHQDQWARVGGDPSLVPTAMEEILRFEPAVSGTATPAAEPFDLAPADSPVTSPCST